MYFIHNKRSLPQDSWYPFNALKSPIFEILVFVQFFGQLFMGQAFSNVFIYFLSISVMLYYQLKILNQHLRNIVNVTLLDFGISKFLVEQFDLQINEKLHERYRQ